MPIWTPANFESGFAAANSSFGSSPAAGVTSISFASSRRVRVISGECSTGPRGEAGGRQGRGARCQVRGARCEVREYHRAYGENPAVDGVGGPGARDDDRGGLG